jgi:hypothetical protein
MTEIATPPFIERGRHINKRELPDRTKSRQEIVRQAIKHAQEMHDVGKHRKVSGMEIHEIKRWAQVFEKQLPEFSGMDDYFAQLYLALLATQLDARYEKLTATLRRELTFPPGYNSPHRPEPRVSEKKK